MFRSAMLSEKKRFAVTLIIFLPRHFHWRHFVGGTYVMLRVWKLMCELGNTNTINHFPFNKTVCLATCAPRMGMFGVGLFFVQYVYIYIYLYIYILLMCVIDMHSQIHFWNIINISSKVHKIFYYNSCTNLFIIIPKRSAC